MLALDQFLVDNNFRIDLGLSAFSEEVRYIQKTNSLEVNSPSMMRKDLEVSSQSPLSGTLCANSTIQGVAGAA